MEESDRDWDEDFKRRHPEPKMVRKNMKVFPQHNLIAMRDTIAHAIKMAESGVWKRVSADYNVSDHTIWISAEVLETQEEMQNRLIREKKIEEENAERALYLKLKRKYGQ